MHTTHFYEVKVNCTTETEETLNSAVIASKIAIVTTTKFPKGIMGKWTSENLFVPIVNYYLRSNHLWVQIIQNLVL